jgi:hypothetical protein
MRKYYAIVFLLALLLLNYFEPVLRSSVEPYCLANNKGPWFCDPELFWSTVNMVKTTSWVGLIVCPSLFLIDLFRQKRAD